MPVKKQEQETDLTDAWELLRQMDAEFAPTQISLRPILQIKAEDIVSIAGTPIEPSRIRRIGNTRVL